MRTHAMQSLFTSLDVINYLLEPGVTSLRMRICRIAE